MKNMRKLFALVLAVMMVLTLAAPVFAEETTYTLTLDKALPGHTYSLYQVFTGDISDGKLVDIEWGSSVSEEGKTEFGDAADKAETLTTAQEAHAFIAQIADYLTSVASQKNDSDAVATISFANLAAGYYLVRNDSLPVDAEGNEADNSVYTYYIMQVVDNVRMDVKADVPEINKEPEVTDANIGDTVTFTLTATMPSDIQGYESYKVIFHDTMSAGLTYAGNLTVKIGDKNVTSSFNIPEPSVDGEGVTTITVSCDNVLAEAVGAGANTQIVVTYDATLNENAIIGAEGNPNKVYLEYSNDPNWVATPEKPDEPTGDTPEDEVKVYTWEIPVFKYKLNGETKEGLAGAGFTLYKDADCTQAVTVTKDANVTDKNVYKVDPASTASEIVTDDTGKFEIEGLDSGTYYLKETTTPAGYNTADTMTVIIGEDGALTAGGNPVSTVEVLNQAGSVLPETGGVGTTMFYLFGGVMVVAAVVLLVTKKRMAA